MRILHYNILDGFAGAPDRIDAFLTWLAHESPDLLSLNEHRPGHDRLRAGLHVAGYVHSAVNTTAPYANRCAVFSRRAFSETETADDFRFLRVRVDGLDLVNYHASPAGVPAVLAEQTRLLRRLADRREVVLVGDCNSLSPDDRERLSREGRPVPHRYLLHGEPSCAFVEGLTREGFREVRTGPPESGSTVPTALPRAHELGLALRLDYAFVRLTGRTARARVLKEPVFDRLSDHYPVLVTVSPAG